MKFQLAKAMISTNATKLENIKEEMLITLAHKSLEYITSRRVAIIQEICRNPEKVDVEDIWIRLREKHKISRGAVYIAIKALVERNLVVKEKAKFGYTYKIADFDQL